jgi:hypothetical protein
VAGGVFLLLAGALTGFVLAPDSPNHTTASVASFNAKTSQLCLSGDGVKNEKDLNAEGQLCGVWRRSGVERKPKVGEQFRYVVVRTSGTADGKSQHQIAIYGDVVE